MTGKVDTNEIEPSETRKQVRGDVRNEYSILWTGNVKKLTFLTDVMIEVRALFNLSDT